jgi:predicted transposase YbfD/YdcC
LINRVSQNHKNLLDVIVYDAIACNSEWINTCIGAGIDTVVRVKSNNIESIKEVKKRVNKMDEVALWFGTKGYESVKIFEYTFNMKNVDKPLRFVKFLMKKADGKRSQIMIVTTSLKMGLKTLLKIIRARQDIENSIFHNLKTECGLEHCFVHGGNSIEAVLCLMFIASNFIQLFYHRRIKRSVKTQVELVRLLLKGLYLLKRKPELVFDTG